MYLVCIIHPVSDISLVELYHHVELISAYCVVIVITFIINVKAYSCVIAICAHKDKCIHVLVFT